MLNNPTGIKGILCKQKFTAISHRVSPASLSDVSAGYCQRYLVDESGLIGTVK
jgi:hypothetical protein